MAHDAKAQLAAQAQQCLLRLQRTVEAMPAAQHDQLQPIIGELQTIIDQWAQQPADQPGTFEAVVRELHDYAFFTYDQSGTIESWNRGAEVIFGFRAADVIGQNVALIFQEPDRAANVPEQQRAIATQTGRSADTRWHLRHDGSQFWGESLIMPLPNQRGGFAHIVRDATQRKQLEDEREQLLASQAVEQALMQAIMDQMPSGLSVAEAPSGRLVLHNREAVRLIRHPLLESQDYQSYVQYGALHLDGRPYKPEEYPIARALFGEIVQQEDMMYRRGDNTLTYLSVNAAPVRDANGVIVRAVSTFHDIAARRYAEAELERLYRSEQQARAEAEAALQSRDTFLTVAAHELRNPIAALLGFAQMLEQRTLRNDQLPARDRQAVQAITAQAQRIDRLISDVLDVARLQSGRFDLHLAPLDMQELVQQVVSEIEPTLEHHTLTATYPDQLCQFNGDRLRLEQVLYNLLHNAVKYSPFGGHISVQLRHDSDAIVLSVSDQGIGIAADALPHLFDRFYRAPNAARSEIKGMGIGLYVVHEIVRLHGGTISVESVEGQGTTFVVRLPCA